MLTFHTESGTKYEVEGLVVTRFSEKPVEGFEHVRFELREPPFVTFGLPAVLRPVEGGTLRTNIVTSIKED